MSLPTLVRTIDDAFTHTWYEIRAEAIDNILDANVVTAALRAKGCFTPQTGGEYITRTIRYGEKSTKNVKKGDTLSHGETQLKTMARWEWKYISAHIQRSLQDDQKNQGKFKIASLVEDRIQAAKEALDDTIETTLMTLPLAAAGGTAAEVKAMRLERDPNSLYNFMPGGTDQGATSAYGASDDYTFGEIGLDNAWWQAQYLTASIPHAINLLDQMKNHYNTIGENKAYPDLIITNQTLFESYENYALDMSQIVKDNGTKLADLGYEVLKFKGKDMVWTAKVATNLVLMLNTDFIEIVYDPSVWFDMGEWKHTQLQAERIAHIFATMQVICTQPRRQGWIGTYAS